MNITRERMAAIAAAAVVAILAVVWFLTHHGSGHDTKATPAPTSTSATTDPSPVSTSDTTPASRSTGGSVVDPSEASQSAASKSADDNATRPLSTTSPQGQTITGYAKLIGSQDSSGSRADWFNQMKAITTPEFYKDNYASSETQTLSPIQQAQASAWASQDSATPAPTTLPTSYRIYPVSDIPNTATTEAYHVSYTTVAPDEDSDGNAGGQDAHQNESYTVFLKKVNGTWLVDKIMSYGG